MSILSLASRNSAARGYDYFQRKKVLSIEKVDEGVFKSRVSGSDGKRYDVYIDTAHPRRSKCNCPYADGTRKMCKHIVATYFTVEPEAAKAYAEAIERERRAEEARLRWEEKRDEKLMNFLNGLSRDELQRIIYDLLAYGPEEQYEEFMMDNIEDYSCWGMDDEPDDEDEFEDDDY